MAYFKTSDGARIHYRLEGKRSSREPVLVFIHGWCSNLEHWQAQVDHFRGSHRILRVDRRGMGKSTTTGQGHNGKQHAEDIAALLRSLKIRRAVAIGHAGGGPSTLELTRRYPRVIKAAVMVDSGMYPRATLNPPAGFGEILRPMLDALAAEGNRALKVMYRGFFAPQADKAMVKGAIIDALQTPLPVVVAELESLACNTQAMARQIKQPVLWLTAAAVDQAYIGAQLKNVQFGQVVGSGHFPQMEVPDQTNAMIATFLDQL